jgi:ketosteroid isomerase-like protein
MSQENVEFTRNALEAYNTRNVEAFIAFCDPQIEFHSAFAAVGGAVYHGHDGIRRMFRDLEDVWGAELRMESEAYFDLGEHTLVFHMAHGRGRHSGAEVAMQTAQLTTWRNGLAVHLKGYVHRQDALTDLGVSEQELEPVGP